MKMDGGDSTGREAEETRGLLEKEINTIWRKYNETRQESTSFPSYLRSSSFILFLLYFFVLIPLRTLAKAVTEKHAPQQWFQNSSVESCSSVSFI